MLEFEKKPSHPTSLPPPGGAVCVRAQGHEFELLPCRTAYWRAKRTLLVADVHLGKSEAFQRAGVPMPSGAMHEALDRLGRVIAETRAERVLVLGDLLHAPAGITASMVEAVRAWRSRVSVRMQVVSGNHDRDIEHVAKVWDMELLGESHAEDGVGFVHDPDSAAAERAGGFVWAGHVHPAITMGRGKTSVKLACFVMSEHVGVLPAFSLFTSGATVAARRGGRVFACAGEEIVEV